MIAVAVAADAVRVPLGLERVRRIARGVLRAEGVRDALISITFVTPRAIARLNHRYVGHRGPTDVIAFGFAPLAGNRRRGPKARAGAPAVGSGVVGDVYIAPGVARRHAAAWRGGGREEIARLVVHLVLHVLGHDHPNGAERVTSPMWRRQEGLVQRLTGASA